MDTDIWIPLATLVLGWAGAQVTEVLRDRRTSDRDRLARRFELQRSTLLNLQDALLELSTAAEAARLADSLAKLDLPDRDDRRLTAWQEKQRLWRAKTTAWMFCSRVEDEQARGLAEEAAAAADGLVPYDAATRDEVYARANDSYQRAMERIGELLRERY
jgi:hypothetical protein